MQMSGKHLIIQSLEKPNLQEKHLTFWTAGSEILHRQVLAWCIAGSFQRLWRLSHLGL